MDPEGVTGRTWSRRWLLGAAGVAGSGLLAAALWLLLRPREPARGPDSPGPPHDPRLTYKGPYRNVRPDVRYVGDAACTPCHKSKADSYCHHPMGRSLAPAGARTPPELLDTRHQDPFEALGSRFRVEREGGRVWHRQTRLDAAGKAVYEFDQEVQYAIGSGTRGISFLSLRDGYAFQTPVSWFGQKRRWGLSPGFEPRVLAGRPVGGGCLFCHANRAHDVAGSQNLYETPVLTGGAIGCERCHGPGELHVKSRDRRDIVDPGKLAPAPREAVCEQCHLEGKARVLRRGRGLYDFRPGLQRQDFWTVFVGNEGAATAEAVNHFEQMYQSRCYQRSKDENKLGCVSCHDPHLAVTPPRRRGYFRRRCLACHADKPCTEKPAVRRKQDNDNCIACHMPRYNTSDIPHTAATDHRVPLRPGARRHAGGPPEGGGLLLREFRPGATDRGKEGARDLALGLFAAARAAKFEGVDPRVPAGQLLPLLEDYLRESPHDPEAWEARAWALVGLGRHQEGLAAAEKALEQDPRRELPLYLALSAALGLGQTDTALGYARRLVEANRQSPSARATLVRLLLKKEAWDEVRPQAAAWSALAPEDAEARMALVRCLLREGRTGEARAEFARVEALRPADLRWYREVYRAQGGEGP
jgi:hypothetical protein